MQLKKLDILFANGKDITIPGEYVEKIVFTDIDSKTSETIALHINRKANVEYVQDNVKVKTVFERLCYSDITELRAELVEKESWYKKKHIRISYFAYWDRNDNKKNRNQSNYIDQEGNIHILISKEWTPKEFFQMASEGKWVYSS